MELRHLRHFLAVAEALNFHRAAQRLNMAQPPLSQSIRRLEESLGVQLLDRSRRGVALTPAGAAFLGEARTALKHADLARKLARREAEQSPEVRVSFVASAMYRLLPQLLADFRKAEPNVIVHLREQPSPLQVAPIMAGDSDIAFVSQNCKGIEECEAFQVEIAQLVAAIPADWPLASQHSVSLADLAEHPFILPPKYDYALGSDATVALFQKAGVMPYVSQGDTHISSTLALIGAGLGCTLTASTAALKRPHNVRFVPISDSAATTNWGLMMIWKPDHLTEVARRFVTVAQHHVRDRPSLLQFDGQAPDA